MIISLKLHERFDAWQSTAISICSLKASLPCKSPSDAETTVDYRQLGSRYKHGSLSARTQPGAGLERRINRPEALAVTCADVFSILGTNGSPAIPGLVKVATQKDPAGAQLALFALSGIGKETIPIFSEIITNQTLPHRVEAIGDLHLVVTPSDSAQLLPIMYSCLQDPDPAVRRAAEASIKQITTYLPRNTVTNLAQ